MQLFDTHCHIQDAPVIKDDTDATYRKWAQAGHPDPADLITSAAEQGVTRLMIVGCDVADSHRAVDLAALHQLTWASIGIHPHEAAAALANEADLEAFMALAARPQVKAVGECGLDYFYENSPRDAQKALLRMQLELAQRHNLPLIFHVRDAFDEFWPIFDEFKGLRGVIHSFTATTRDLEQILHRGLYVGLNGITTFMKDQAQLEAVKAVPLEKMLLETDAPFLTPAPDRGTICEPKHVRVTAEFLADLRGESLQELADATTRNARLLFDV
jgi:TatD DNase family protein